MSSTKADFSPLGKISLSAHNAAMPVDHPEQRREALRKFIRAAEIVVSRWEVDANIGSGTVRKFLSGKSKSLNGNTYQRLASAAERKLGRVVLVEELMGIGAMSLEKNHNEPAVRRLDDYNPPPPQSTMARDVPVLGTISSRAGGLMMGVEHALDFVRRPPRYADRLGKSRDIFAVLVEEVSMAPKYGLGDLLYIDPLRPAQVGDAVVVECQEDAKSEPRVLLKVLKERTAAKITLAQYNPPRTFDIELAHVVALYRVMTINDLLGS